MMRGRFYISSFKAIPPAERPREKMLRLGPEVLGDDELVAILLGTGTRGRTVLEVARQLLDTYGGVRGLAKLRAAELQSLSPGLGEAKLCQILAALQLGLRAARDPAVQVSLGNPEAVYRFLAPTLLYLDHEQFVVLHVNAKNRLVDSEVVSVGTLTASLVHPREIFKSAIRRGSHAIVVAHNHPSGDPTPSREDNDVTNRLSAAGELLGIALLDHIVVGDGRFVSFRERRLGPWA